MEQKPFEIEPVVDQEALELYIKNDEELIDPRILDETRAQLLESLNQCNEIMAQYVENLDMPVDDVRTLLNAAIEKATEYLDQRNKILNSNYEVFKRRIEDIQDQIEKIKSQAESK